MLFHVRDKNGHAMLETDNERIAKRFQEDNADRGYHIYTVTNKKR